MNDKTEALLDIILAGAEIVRIATNAVPGPNRRDFQDLQEAIGHASSALLRVRTAVAVEER